MSRTGKILAIGGVFVASIIGAAIATNSQGNNQSSIVAGESQVQTLRFSMSSNNKHPIYDGAAKFKEIVEKFTELKVDIYPSAQLGDDRAAIEMLQLGTLDVSIPSTGPLANFYPEYNVFDLPFMITSEDVADKVLRSEFGDDMLKRLESKGLVGLDFWENGFRHVTNSRRAVKSIEDVKGLKIRTMESPLHLDAWKAMGATPTPMAFNELFTALQQGTVDGQENPYPNIALNNLFEVQETLSNTGHVYTPLALIVSQATWNKLSRHDQRVLRQAAIDAGDYERQVNRRVNLESLDVIKQNMEVVTLTPEALVGFQEATKPVIEEYTPIIGKDVVSAFQEQIKKAENELAAQ
ncbi:TRAP transporter substrate-binding protein [Vibrio splendidus]|uniref:TRAP transporter substrate-binding protein n=1 Tax=Vibrio splendidus TaxID=29497 RepID=UPI000C84DD6B|nr:TRAP transporter substrate-binding protein [Vibrio splendidus]PMI76892.1 ABC transporter substrate-binding protein [Vibrio splendidus]PMM34237.1 ABC transporter substrate-binding protein [Vibrio splendidus]PTP68030.1 ABC transporter substrate-binding protein [Vibrio splendidus]